VKERHVAESTPRTSCLKESAYLRSVTVVSIVLGRLPSISSTRPLFSGGSHLVHLDAAVSVGTARVVEAAGPFGPAG
jgi:hypothetical protein